MILTLEGSPSAKRPDQSRSFSRLSVLDPLSPSNAPASTKKPLRWKGHFRLTVVYILLVFSTHHSPEEFFYQLGLAMGMFTGTIYQVVRQLWWWNYHLPHYLCKTWGMLVCWSIPHIIQWTMSWNSIKLGYSVCYETCKEEVPHFQFCYVMLNVILSAWTHYSDSILKLK